MPKIQIAGVRVAQKERTKRQNSRYRIKDNRQNDGKETGENLSGDLGYMDTGTLMSKLEEVSKLLNAYAKSILNSDS